MTAPAKILLNALHTTTGGGLVYLQHVLPFLAHDPRFELTLLAPAATLEHLPVPSNIAVWQAPELGFAAGHLWEQLVLPFAARARGFDAMWCNANYVPLLAKKPVPTIHTTPRAAAQALSRGMKIYWWAVKLLTRLSLLRAPAALSVANHVIADYAGPRTARKVRVASPAAPVAESAPARREGNVVLVVGDYYPQKNYPELLRAVAMLHKEIPAVRLRIVGRAIDPVVASQVRDCIDKFGLQKVVTELGPLPHAKLLDEMASATVLVSLSRAECFNMPVLEALGQGTPAVVGDYDFQHEVAGDAALYVPLEKGGDVPAAVAVALSGVLLNPKVSAHLARAGRTRAGTFSWQNTARTIGDTLASIL